MPEPLKCLNCGMPIPCLCGKNQIEPIDSSDGKLLLGQIEVTKAEPKLEPVAPPIEEVTPETNDELLNAVVKAVAEEKPVEGEYVLDEALKSQKTFSVIEPVVGNPDPVPVPEKVEVSVTTGGVTGSTEIKPEVGRVESFTRNPALEEIFLRGKLQSGAPVEVAMSFEMLAEFLKVVLPPEELKIQELLDKIHKIRESRGLFVEEIDDGLTELAKDADAKFQKCENKVDVAKVSNAFRAKLTVLTQKRYLAKFSIQEESELSLLLAKLNHSE